MMARQKWVVDYEEDVANQLHAAFKDGRITTEDMRVIKYWVREVEEMGLKFVQNNENWRDHELARGKWIGHRAISFSYSGRIIYRAEENHLTVMIVRMTSNHDHE